MQRKKKITDYQPDENVVNPSRLIVIIRSSRRIFSFGKRNGRWANLHCGITCRKLTANNFCQFIFIYGWIKPMDVVSFLLISLRHDDVCLVVVMMMRMMIIKATLTHVSITIAITIVIKQCVLDFCLIIEYCLGYIAIWAHVFVWVYVYVWYSCVSDLHAQKSPKCRDVLRFNKHRTKSFCSAYVN